LEPAVGKMWTEGTKMNGDQPINQSINQSA